MVGYNTALADNPQLTARSWPGKQPLRIVLDRQLGLPITHYLLGDSTETWIINEREEQLNDLTSRIQIAFNQNLLPTLLNRLKAANKTSLFVEGGARLLQSF